MSKSTKKQILKSFSELLKVHELDKITVTMLVSECDISRQTFYYHFSDVQDLINWGIMQNTAGCLNEAKKATNIIDATKIYLSNIEKNRFYLTKCLSSSLSGYTTLLIRNSIIEYSSSFCYNIIKINDAAPEDTKFIIEFIANAVTGLIISSLYQKQEMNIDDTAERLSRTILSKLSSD